MAIVTALLAPIHLFSFSALLGSQLYQTFIVTKVTFQRLPRAPFINLQKYLFPIYFQSQALLLFISAATLPPHGPFSLIQHKSDWIPFAVSTFVSALNLTVFGPRTRKLMLDRVEQGKYVFWSKVVQETNVRQELRMQRRQAPRVQVLRCKF
jgi:hypothetical protein